MFRFSRRTLLKLSALIPGVEGASADSDFASVIAAVRGAVDTDAAMTYMRGVYATDRRFTFPAFAETAQYLLEIMKTIGLEDAEIVQTPADGTTQVGYWTMPLAWDAKSARLEILDDRLPAEQRVLADYERVPASLGMWSGPTPPGGIETEIAVVSREALRCPESIDIRGKLALMNVNPAGYKWLLVKAGALGAVNAFTENPDLEDGRQWVNAWGDSGWAYTKRSTPLLSFSITPRQNKLLRQLLASGPVRVRATVNTRYEGSYPYVTGVVKGSGEEEALTLAHTSEQGAQDNATGVAATLSALGTLRRLIDAKKLATPRRSIRVLLMGEMYGSMHYVAANPERIRKTVAALCVDTPAGRYDLAGTEYSFYMNPDVAKDFTDALILKIAAAYFPSVHRPWHEKAFATGTDTYLAEPMVGVPTVWSYSGSGVETHHNSEDTPDRVDPRSLRDLSIVTAAFLYSVANAGEAEALRFAALSETRGYGQIANRTGAAIEGMNSGSGLRRINELVGAAEEGISYAVGRESQSISSVERLVPDSQRAKLRKQLSPALLRLKRFGEAQIARVHQAAEQRVLALGLKGGLQPRIATREDAREGSQIVVKRKRFGTIPLDDLPQEEWEGQPSGAWALVPTIALYWCDGRRTLAEVIRLTELELGPSKFDYAAYFRFLQRRGNVEFIS